MSHRLIPRVIGVFFLSLSRPKKRKKKEKQRRRRRNGQNARAVEFERLCIFGDLCGFFFLFSRAFGPPVI
jgi:hypothetical protein